jgi:hypothetical protein
MEALGGRGVMNTILKIKVESYFSITSVLLRY